MAIGATGRARLLGAVVVVLTFAAGGLGGAAVERVLGARDGARASSRERGRGEIECEPRRNGGRRRTPYDALGLTAEQKTQIDAVIESQNARMGEIWRETRPRMDAVVEQTRAEVRALLTPDQIEDLDRRRAERARQQAVRDSIRREEYRQKCGTPDSAQAAPRGARAPGPRGQFSRSGHNRSGYDGRADRNAGAAGGQ